MKHVRLQVVKSGNQASDILDLMRFLSAIVVFLFHFYVPLPGYQAVMVFFVLSGYFISSTILKALETGRWNWGDYLLKRATRLWIVLLPALILTYIWAKVQLGLFGEEFSPPELKISEYLSWGNFFGNLFFMQGIVVDPFGLNGPLWSLSYEFWYYMLFPCIVLIFYSKKKKHKLIYLLVSVVIGLFVGQEILKYFLIWLLGAVIPLIRWLNIKGKLTKNLIILISVFTAIYSMNYESGNNFIRDFLVGLAYAWLIYLIASVFNDRKSDLKINFPKYLAGFSYTLYLTHYPLANFILTWRVSPLWPFEGNSLLVKASLAFIVFGYAWLIALLTEKHTDKVRKYIANLIFKIRKRYSVNQIAMHEKPHI